MLLYLYLLTSVVLSSVGLGSMAQEIDTSAYRHLQRYTPKEEINLAKINADSFSSFALKDTGFTPKVYAKSAIALDTTSGQVLYDYNVKEKLPLASLTKIMTAVVILENTENNNLDDVVTISRDAALVEGSRMGLWIEEEITLDGLLYGLILKSGNDAAVAIEEYYEKEINKDKQKAVGDYPESDKVAGAETEKKFISLMNKKAQELGMKDTVYRDSSGINDGNQSTVNDQAILLDYAMRNPLFRKYMGTEQYSTQALNGPLRHEMTTTNRLLKTRDDVLAGKTGYSEAAGWNMITLFKTKEGHQIATVVLGTSSNDERFNETNRIIDWVFNSYRW